MIDRNDLNTKDDVARESIEIRKLELDDCKKIMEIDRTEAIEGIFVFTEGRLVLEKGHRGITNWTKEEKEQRIKRAEAEVDNPNVIMIGAFHNDLLVGYIRVALISLNHREGMWRCKRTNGST